jgi:methylglutaconyl-CoA hydratase
VSDEFVHLGIAAGVATITLDSPHNRNALSRQLVGELARHLDSALADERAHVVVLTGAGPAFCSGADLKEQREANESAGEPRSTGLAQGGLPQILTAIWESPKPVICRLNGPARAGGLGLVAACDFAIAPESVTFAINEVRLGVIPAIISVVLLPKLGAGKALELFLTGEPFSAKQAVEYGILTAAAPDGELDATVARYVSALRKGGPNALAGAKRLVREVPGMPMAAAFNEMAKRSAAFFASEEGREGLRSFAEKRQPAWAEGVE